MRAPMILKKFYWILHRNLRGNPSVDETIHLIQRLHAGQTDWSGVPYHTHPIRVMNRLSQMFDNVTLEEKLEALLHDTVEDTEATPEFLTAFGYSAQVVSGVV